jgi:hypothetical protein
MKCIDPSTMSAGDRIAELAEILAAGVQRFLARENKASPPPRNQQEALDVVGAVEAPCPSPMECPA